MCRLHHALERHVVLAGKTGAVLVLGRRALAAVGQGGYFDGHLTPRRHHLLKATRQADALHNLTANAIGRGFQKDNRLQTLDILVRANYLQLPAGTALFAVEGQPVHLAGAGLAQTVGGVGEHLGRRVVDVALQLDDGFGRIGLARQRRCTSTLHTVRILSARARFVLPNASTSNVARGRRDVRALKFAPLNNFEHSAQFIGQKITLGILIQPPMVL